MFPDLQSEPIVNLKISPRFSNNELPVISVRDERLQKKNRGNIPESFNGKPGISNTKNGVLITPAQVMGSQAVLLVDADSLLRLAQHANLSLVAQEFS